MKDNIRTEGNLSAVDGNFPCSGSQGPGGGKLPLFIEFPVVGQHRFGDQRQNAPGLHDGGRVVQGIPVQERKAHDGDCAGFFRGLRKTPQAFQGSLSQARLEEKVSAGISGDAQLRKNDGGGLLFRGFPEARNEPVNVVVHISYPELGDGGGKSVVSEHGRRGLENGTRG